MRNISELVNIILGSASAVAAAFFGNRTADMVNWLSKLVGAAVSALEAHGVTVSPLDLERWKADAERRAKILGES